jgi:hypothetical protein
MTSWLSLLNCAQGDVTLERIAALAASTGTEPLTVEFKEKISPRVAECIAAMANGYSGLIFVGITDNDHQIVGVKTETMAHIADMLTASLDPPDYMPEMFEVPLGPDQPGLYVVVIRIRHETAPRPVLVQRTIRSGNDKSTIFTVPVRRPGGTRQATRAEMASLFAEQPEVFAEQSGWEVQAPHLPSTQKLMDDGTAVATAPIDLRLQTGLFIQPGPSAPGRPLSERVIDDLCATLNRSQLTSVLFKLANVTPADAFRFSRQGIPNTSSTATLVWQFAGEPPPFEVKLLIESPDQYGHSQIQTLQVTLQVTSQLSAWSHHDLDLGPETMRRRFDTAEWIALLESVVATLTDSKVVSILADLADADPILVPAPRTLHLVTGIPIARILPEHLIPIPGTGSSRGAHLRADPTLDLSDPQDRFQQAVRWLVTISGDAGLRGMEALLSGVEGPGAESAQPG